MPCNDQNPFRRTKLQYLVVLFPGTYKRILIQPNIIKLSRLVNWLRVPTHMRENRVRAWVEVVDSLQCINTRGIAEFNQITPTLHCRVQRNSYCAQ